MYQYANLQMSQLLNGSIVSLDLEVAIVHSAE
jgi:hypothetical protein